MKNFLKICGFLALFVLMGCNNSQKVEIEDLQKPQDATLFVEENLPSQDPQKLAKLKEEYLKRFFAPFVDLVPNPNIQEVFWIQASLQKNAGYGENLKPNSLEYTQDILDDMQIELYPSVAQRAIVIKDSDVRAVPTLKPRFSKANGYPFDRWQNSSIFYGTPVLITHYDKTRRFAHIQTEFVYGWVEVSNLALISKKQIQRLLSVKDFVMPNNDSVLIMDQNKKFLTQGRIGKLFMLNAKYQMLVFKRTASGDLKIETTSFDQSQFHTFPQSFSQLAVAESINHLIGQRYGWGGMYESRDCSAFIRDIFSQFGLYLPRNSFAQAKFGTHQVNLKNLKLEQKEKMILQNATPFSTLIWLKGHIMLYIGKDKQGNPMVAHSGWSVQTSDLFSKKEHLLGGVVITTLKPGNEWNGWFNQSPTLGDRAEIINNLYPSLEGLQ